MHVLVIRFSISTLSLYSILHTRARTHAHKHTHFQSMPFELVLILHGKVAIRFRRIGTYFKKNLGFDFFTMNFFFIFAFSPIISALYQYFAPSGRDYRVAGVDRLEQLQRPLFLCC